MNRDQKAAVIEEVAAQLQAADAVFAVDPRGLSVKQAADLRERLHEAGATLRVVKNRLTVRSAERAGAEQLTGLLLGPTAFTFVSGDVALAAKALATFQRESQLLAFKGGMLEGDALTVEQIQSIARLPARDVLHGQFVGVLAAPLTGLVRCLAALISGLAIQLRQIEEQGLVGGAADGVAPGRAAPRATVGEQPAREPEIETPTPSDEPGDPVAEGEAAEQEAEPPSQDDQRTPQAETEETKES